MRGLRTIAASARRRRRCGCARRVPRGGGRRACSLRWQRGGCCHLNSGFKERPAADDDRTVHGGRMMLPVVLYVAIGVLLHDDGASAGPPCENDSCKGQPIFGPWEGLAVGETVILLAATL